jgi:hypothetical protein
VTAYQRSSVDPRPWIASLLNQSMHMTHNFDLLPSSDTASGETLLIGGSEGIMRIDASGATERIVDNPPSRGAGEVRWLRVTSPAEIAAIEPMHGNEVVFYGRRPDGTRNRIVVDSSLSQGHGLATGDLLNQGRDQIVAGWREKDSSGRVGIRLYIPDESGSHWQCHVIDDNHMACEDLKLADLDADGRIEIIAAGRATRNLIVYWNRSEN